MEEVISPVPPAKLAVAVERNTDAAREEEPNRRRLVKVPTSDRDIKI